MSRPVLVMLCSAGLNVCLCVLVCVRVFVQESPGPDGGGTTGACD